MNVELCAFGHSKRRATVEESQLSGKGTSRRIRLLFDVNLSNQERAAIATWWGQAGAFMYQRDILEFIDRVVTENLALLEPPRPRIHIKRRR